MKVPTHQHKVLVFGFYKGVERQEGNLGDQLFMDAFYLLFPQLDFVFTDHIETSHLEGIDIIFFGGGAFLGDKPKISPEAFQLLLTKKLFYLGVGVEDHIDPLHIQLMKQAQLIAVRSTEQLTQVQNLNPKTCFLPDLVYALQPQVKQAPKLGQSVLIMPNISVLPHNASPHWKYAAWTYFKSELSQFADWLISQGYQTHFFSMCHTVELEDDWAASELIGAMKRRNAKMLLPNKPQTMEAVSQLVSQYDVIITQRYHGIILAEMTQTPCLTLYHHDKLKKAQSEGKFLSYYGLTKDQLINEFQATLKIKMNGSFIVAPTVFSAFSQEVLALLN